MGITVDLDGGGYKSWRSDCLLLMVQFIDSTVHLFVFAAVAAVGRRELQ